VKAKLPRVTELDDGDRWLIDVDDGVRLVYWRDENNICHVVIERERQQQKVA